MSISFPRFWKFSAITSLNKLSALLYTFSLPVTAIIHILVHSTVAHKSFSMSSSSKYNFIFLTGRFQMTHVWVCWFFLLDLVSCQNCPLQFSFYSLYPLAPNFSLVIIFVPLLNFSFCLVYAFIVSLSCLCSFIVCSAYLK